jgi:hypothetical protein
VTAALGSLDALAERIEQLDARFLLVALLVQLANLGFRSLAWRGVVAAAYPSRRIPVFSVVGSYAAGVAVNAFTPARAGELAKAMLLRARLPGSSVATIGASLSVVLLVDAALGGTLIVTFWALGLLPALPPLPSVPPMLLVALPAAAALVVVVIRRRPAAVRRFLSRARVGFAVLRSPRRYVTSVLPFQLAAWCCRIGVVLLVLAAFRIEAGVETAALIVVAGGLATVVPVPGGVGTQQVLAAYALHNTVSIGSAVSFSLGMQLGVTVVNTFVGTLALMLMMRTLQPASAVRAGLETVRSARSSR